MDKPVVEFADDHPHSGAGATASVIVTGQVVAIVINDHGLWWDGVGWSSYSPNDKISLSKAE